MTLIKRYFQLCRQKHLFIILETEFFANDLSILTVITFSCFNSMKNDHYTRSDKKIVIIIIIITKIHLRYTI